MLASVRISGLYGAVVMILATSCAGYRTVINQSNGEFNWQEASKDVEVGNEVVLVSHDIEYKGFSIALMDDESITLVRMVPRPEENNYFRFRYDDIEQLYVKLDSFNDKVGIPFSLTLVVLFLLV